MPFDLVSSGACFYRCMNYTFSEIPDKYFVVNLDDILVYFKDLFLHITHAGNVL